MRKTLLLACCSVLACAIALRAGEIKLARHPSYHAGKIAFSYAGDIWVVNEDGSSPLRITDHKARDVYPRFSPDGKWIAFSSNRYGNDDVFVVSAAGGKPKQLTFHTAADDVVGWSADGKKVIFRTARSSVFPGTQNLFEVPVNGGLEQPLPTDWGYWGGYSPDGKQFAFNRHPSVWWRQHYRGSYAADLWVMDVAAKKSRKLIDEVQGPNSFWPMFGNSEIFFVSDRLANEKGVKPGSPEVMKSVNNIWKIPAAGGKPVQVTKHTTGRLFWPSISADGKVVVYEENFGLWKLDTATGQTSEVKVRIDTDEKENNVETVTVTGEADHFSLSPSGRRAVISTRGEMFTIATERGDVSPVAESQYRETFPAWSPDGKWVAFISDRSGQDEIWICDQLGNKLRKITDAATEKSPPEWSPDSQYLLYADSEKKLYRVALNGGKTDVVTTGEAGRILGYSFSPDGKWVSFTRAGRDVRAQVYVAAAAGGDEHRISSEEMFNSTGAAWTRDGKSLLFVAGGLTGGGVGAVVGGNPSADLYVVSLTKLDKNPADRDIDDEEAAAAALAAAAPAGGGFRAGGGAPDRMPEVKFDWDGLPHRARRLTRLTGSISNIAPAPDSRTAAFVNGAGGGGGGGFGGGSGQTLYTVTLDIGTLTRITQVTPPAPSEDAPPPAAAGGFGGGIGNLNWARDGRSLYFREGRAIYAATIGGAAPAGPAAAAAAGGAGRRGGGAAVAAPVAAAAVGGEPRRVNFTVHVEVDHRAERKEVYEESWRIMKHRFYDAKMHGADWDKAKALYEPMLEHAYDKEEMANIILQTIGEMNASHTGFTAGAAPGVQREAQTRYPGFDLAADSSGFYKVGHIYKNGPADHEYVKIHSGDYILAVDDQELKSGDNYWKNFTVSPGRKFKFLVNSKPLKDGAWDVRIEPLGSAPFTTLQYEKWVADRRAMVEKTSGGEIGYVHIRAMNEPSLRQFERELAENHAKKALVIDQRFNGGGGIDQELLQILNQRTRYQYTRGRGGVEVDRPLRAFYGPMVVIENERSASDAEMFPQGFKDLKLGKVVGVNTMGAVIGTGAYTLMDGSTIRTPGSGVWAMSGQNMENFGVPPDVYVDNTPDDFLKGRDAQVEKAVEVLQEEIRKKK